MGGPMWGQESKNQDPQDPPPTKTLKPHLKPLKPICSKMAKNWTRDQIYDGESKNQHPNDTLGP